MYRIINRSFVSKKSIFGLQRCAQKEKWWESVRALNQSSKSDSLFPERVDFPSRHIGPRDQDIVTMLDLLEYKVRTK